MAPFEGGDGFDYAALPAEVADEARDIANAARALHRTTVEGQFEIGLRLLALRERLDRGQFVKWIEGEFSTATAYRFMNVASNLAGELLTVRNLPLTVIYELAAPSTPATTRTEIIDSLKSGEPPEPATIKVEVKAARKAAKAEAKLTSDDKKKQEKRQRRTAAQRQAEQERQDQERVACLRGQATAAADAIQILVDRLQLADLRRLAELVEKADERSLIWDTLRGTKRSWHGDVSGFLSPGTAI